MSFLHEGKLTRREFFVAGTAVAITSSCGRMLESGPAEGWTRFRSVNYPYQIDYPSGWTTATLQFGPKKVDVFKGEVVQGFQTNVNIFAESVNSWVTLDDYADHVYSEITAQFPGALTGKDAKKEKIADLDFKFLDAQVPLPGGSSYSFGTRVFLIDGKGWQITQSLHSSIVSASQLEKFREMVSTFKTIK